MAEFSQNRNPLFRESDTIGPTVGNLRVPQSAQGRIGLSAYNLARKQFLSNSVEVGYLSVELLEEFLKSFMLESGIALWIAPIRDLPFAIFSLPVDWVRLDQSCVVLDAVASYPIAIFKASGIWSAYVPIFPAQTNASVGIQAGDKLILCSPGQNGTTTHLAAA